MLFVEARMETIRERSKIYLVKIISMLKIKIIEQTYYMMDSYFITLEFLSRIKKPGW